MNSSTHRAHAPRIFPRPPLAAVTALLDDCGLPTSDLDQHDLDEFLGCGPDEQPLGVIGLERCGNDGLLRSLAVAPSVRGAGCGAALVARLEQQAHDRGIRCLYLLTETAEAFFAARGYQVIERSLVPDAVRATSEFASLCPDDATVMRKALDE